MVKIAHPFEKGEDYSKERIGKCLSAFTFNLKLVPGTARESTCHGIDGLGHIDGQYQSTAQEYSNANDRDNSANWQHGWYCAGESEGKR
jgi:hypothetical protein